MADPPGDSGQFARLEQALERWLDFVDQGKGADPEAFLESVDPELRPLLGPMLDVRPEPPPEPATPARIAGFRIVREIGRGGMGVVYEAVDDALERRLALKILGPHVASSPSSLERFRREGAAAARLSHPGIVEVYGIGETDDGVHWIAMELVEGVSLSERLRGPSLGVLEGASRAAELAEICAQVAEALDYAHAQSVVHRDIKPHNLLLTSDGKMRIVDFGLAKMLDRDSLSITGEFAGSLAYASPEQVSGSRAVDARADVWALGVVLYEGLHGSRPFEGDTHAAVVRNILSRDPALPDAPRDLQTICLKALEKEPEHRFVSAGAMAADLRRFLVHEPIHAVPPGTVSRLMRYVRRRRGVVVAAAAVLVFGGLALWQFLEGRQQAGVLTELARSAQNSLVELERVIREDNRPIAARDIDTQRRRIEQLVRESEGLLALQPDDRALIGIVGRASDHAGQLYQLLKLEREALAAHDRAEALFARLLSTDGDDLVARGNLAACRHNRHILHRAMGRDDLAEADLAKAIADWQLLIDRTGVGDVGRHARYQLAAALTNRGRRRFGSPAATADFDRAVALLGALAERHETTREELKQSLQAHTARSVHLLATGNTDSAATGLDAVLQRISLLSAADREAMAAVHAEALQRRARIARLRGDLAAARADLDIAIRLRTHLASGGAVDHVVELIHADTALAGLLIENDVDLDQAGALLERDRTRLRELRERHPTLVVAQQQLATVASLIASLRVGQDAAPEEAEAALREAVELHSVLHAARPGPAARGDLAEVEGQYGAWLRKARRLDEARTILARALDGTAEALAAAPGNPVLTRNFLYQIRELMGATDVPGSHEALLALARRVVAALPRDPGGLRLALRALDRAVLRRPGSRADRSRWAAPLAEEAIGWIRAVDAAGVAWRRDDLVRTLQNLSRHPGLGPLLQAPGEGGR